MDFRKTYAGHGLRSGSDPFAQLSKDVRQERDDHGRPEPNGGTRLNRPTQSSIAKGVGDSHAHRNSLSARASGRYTSLSQSVDLSPTVPSAGKSNIPRQASYQQQQGQHQYAPPSPPPPSATTPTRDVQLKLQDLVDAGQQRETLLLEQKRQLEASLHTANLRCTELARGLQKATAALDAERAVAALLRTERDEHAAELDRARSQAAELQVSGSVALTTSEVCRAALSSAFKGTVSAIGSAHEELESALAVQQQQHLELVAMRAHMEELEEVAYERGEELEAVREERRQLSDAMEELAERLQAREDELGRLVSLLVSARPEDAAGDSDGLYQAAVARAKGLTERVQQLEEQLGVHNSDLDALRSQVAGYQEQIARLQQDLMRINSSSFSSIKSISLEHQRTPADLEMQVTELANEREQLEVDNLQLAAENEQLRQDVSAMREQLEEALVTAAVFTAATDRDVSAAAELSRLQQQLAEAMDRANSFYAQAEAARVEAQAAERRAEQSAGLLLDFTSEAEAARAQANAARGALDAARVEGRKLRGELEVVRARETEARIEAEEARVKVERARAKVKAARLEVNTVKAEANDARRELEAVRAMVSLEVQQARAEGEERACMVERELLEALETRAAREQELAGEAAQLRNRVSELQDQLAADRRTSREALEQLNTVHANEGALMQRILAGEAERQQLLRQLDEGNGTLSLMRVRVDEAVQQAAEVTQLRTQVADLTAEAERQAGAAATMCARVAPLEAEVQELRATLRATAELAKQDARVNERQEAQLARLRQQVTEAEDQLRQSEEELRVLKAQVSVNERLCAHVDDLEARLLQAEAALTTTPSKTSLIDACTQVDTAVDNTVEVTNYGQGFVDSCSANGNPLSPIECLENPLRCCTLSASPRPTPHVQALAHAAAQQSLVLRWFDSSGIYGNAWGAGGDVRLFSTEHVVAENLLASYNAIPEEGPNDMDGATAKQYDKNSSSSTQRRHAGRVQPLRLMLGLAIKGTLVAGGMALGLALGNPRAFQALTCGSNGSEGGSGGRAANGDDDAVAVEEGMARLT
ncbi:hypothetical protein VaNZ11_001197 [Volvox africanus]|uniref:Uncharacterized protein n=1 Tax=Volvox africanus TaxID=51714 RepID=A0ABQ5RQ57_9CHLO|nr:hypothetical protein VaNZ11_001197 [Volvox africanus]